MENSISPPAETFRIRCPRLGHQIQFSYCRNENFGLPCSRILDCWYPHFQVEKYLRKELTQEEWHEAFEKDIKPKMMSLMELINQAHKRKEKEGK